MYGQGSSAFRMRKLLASRGTVKAPDMQGCGRSRSFLFLVTAVSTAVPFLVSAAHMLTRVTNNGNAGKGNAKGKRDFGIGEVSIACGARSRWGGPAVGAVARTRLQYDGMSDMTERQRRWEPMVEPGRPRTAGRGARRPGSRSRCSVRSAPHRKSRHPSAFRHQRKSPYQRTSRQWYELQRRPGAAGRPTPRPSGVPATPEPAALTAAVTPLAAPPV